MKIHYRVQSVPGRERVRERLLKGLPPAVEVIVDDGPPPGNPWRGLQLCFTDIPECTHLVTVQDDAIVCRNFSLAVERIAAARPDVPVALFMGGVPLRTVNDARKRRGQRYVPIHFRDFIPVVSVLWPRECAEAFLEWSRDAPLPGHPRPPRSDDAVAGAWMRASRTQALVCLPSLVEHPDDVESTIGRPHRSGLDKGRVAFQWIGPEADPLELDWNT